MKFVNQRNKVEGSQEAHFTSRLQGGGKGEILVEIVFRDKEEGGTNELVVTLILVKTTKELCFIFGQNIKPKGS
jgi:hypothetical protein